MTARGLGAHPSRDPGGRIRVSGTTLLAPQPTPTTPPSMAHSSPDSGSPGATGSTAANPDPTDSGSEAPGLCAEHPVFDAHQDSLLRALDLGHDLGVAPGPEPPHGVRGHFDLERARAGGLGSAVFVSWCEPSFLSSPDRHGEGGALRRTRQLLAEFHALLERHPAKIAFAGNGPARRRIRGEGRIAGIPGIEGGHSIEESIGALEWFFERGVRMMTLVWNNHLRWIRSCRGGAGPEVPKGLSSFGRGVVRRMNELGMVVDLSHAGERSFYDTLETSSRPVVASHSGCASLHDHPRNLTDEQLRALRDQGGVVGIVFCVPFLDGDARQEDTRIRESEAYRGIRTENATARFFHQGEHLQAQALPLPIDRVVDHIAHAVEVAGIEHVGIGSDFDGIQRRPLGLEDARGYPALAECMLKRGFDAGEVRAILGGNMERVFDRVTGPGTRASTQGLVALRRGDRCYPVAP